MTAASTMKALMLAQALSAQPAAGGARHALQLSNTFHLTVHAPREAAIELFGAHGERAWAGPDWNPRFLTPLPPEDRAGAVFLVPEGDREILGLTTIFDRAGGRVRHVFVRGERSVSVIDIRLAAIDAATTRVSVTYERTALNAEAEREVRELASGDAAQAREWEAAIDAALRAGATPGGGGRAR